MRGTAFASSFGTTCTAEQKALASIDDYLPKGYVPIVRNAVKAIHVLTVQGGLNANAVGIYKILEDHQNSNTDNPSLDQSLVPLPFLEVYSTIDELANDKYIAKQIVKLYLEWVKQNPQ
jgi:hypothetical protein